MARVPRRAAKGIMSKLNKHLKWVDDPFDPKTKKLMSDVQYTTSKKGSNAKYTYTTDSKGRIKSAQAKPLQLTKTPRARHNPKTPGKRDGDHAGHLIADQFDGSPQLDNLVSQASDVNLKKMGALERNWRKLLEQTPPARIDVDIEVLYGSGPRPTGFRIVESIDGVKSVHTFKN